MEGILRWRLLTLIPAVVWGATYYVTRHTLPADSPLWGAVLRALPAGLLLLLIARRLPRGAWWWRSAVLGMLNTGAFFALVYLAAQLLPTGIASVVMAASPLVMMGLSAVLLGRRLRVAGVGGALLGLAGVVLMLWSGPDAVDPRGIAAAVGAMAMSSLGYVLMARWTAKDGTIEVLPATAWQLVAGGIFVLPVAALVEGAPPVLDSTALVGFGYLTVIATAAAYLLWFAGLARLGPSDLALIGLANPLTGVLLGAGLASERLSARQWLGAGLLLAGVVLGQERAVRRTPPGLSRAAKPDTAEVSAAAPASPDEAPVPAVCGADPRR
ncbi:MAG: DMT family transporter [Cellulomonas sp.]|nr:DMT family transporter [Cellulomonas sp.]